MDRETYRQTERKDWKTNMPRDRDAERQTVKQTDMIFRKRHRYTKEGKRDRQKTDRRQASGQRDMQIGREKRKND